MRKWDGIFTRSQIICWEEFAVALALLRSPPMPHLRPSPVSALRRLRCLRGLILALAYIVAIVVMATFFPDYVGGPRSEAGAVGALGALIITVIKRKLDRGTLWKVLAETGHIVASILMLIVAATMYSRMLAISGLPSELGEWIGQTELGFYGILAAYVTLLIVLGSALCSLCMAS